MVTLLISIIVAKRKDIKGYRYLRDASIWFLISMAIGLLIVILLSSIGKEEISDLSLLPLIITYLYIYKFSITLRDESNADVAIAL